MKRSIFVYTILVFMVLQSCTISKRYHTRGVNIQWHNNYKTKNNGTVINKRTYKTHPIIALAIPNKSLGEISNSEDELPNRAETNILQSLPFEQNSFVRLININKTNTKSILPPDPAKIAKIAKIRLKMKSRFKRLGSTTLFTILTLKIIDFFDGDDSDWSNAYVFALLFFVYLWILLLFIALITWVVYQIKKLSYNINH